MMTKMKKMNQLMMIFEGIGYQLLSRQVITFFVKLKLRFYYHD